MAWFAGTDHGLALHVGRSGAVAFDVDHPEAMPDILVGALSDTRSAFQQTRPDEDPLRGHYLFAVPEGRMIGNGAGGLRSRPSSWGEVRGRNGMIMAFPSAETEGAYRWDRTGPLPLLPASLDELLGQVDEDGAGAATDAEVETFLRTYAGGLPRRGEALLSVPLEQARAAQEQGRHDTFVMVTVWAMDDARAGLYPARLAAERLRAAFDAVKPMLRPGEVQPPKGQPQKQVPGEWQGILAWAVGQANAKTDDQVRERRRRVDQERAWCSSATQAGLPSLLAALRTYQDLPAPGHVLAALAVAATRDLDDEAASPC